MDQSNEHLYKAVTRLLTVKNIIWVSLDPTLQAHLLAIVHNSVCSGCYGPYTSNGFGHSTCCTLASQDTFTPLWIAFGEPKGDAQGFRKRVEAQGQPYIILQGVDAIKALKMWLKVVKN